jgi:hypothetical protein
MRTTLTVSPDQLAAFLDGAWAAAGTGFHATGPALARALHAEGFDFARTLGGPLGGGFYLAETRERALRHWTSGETIEVAYRLDKAAEHQDVLRAREQAKELCGPEPEDAFSWGDWTQEWQNRLSALLQAEGFDGAILNCLYENADYRLVG